MDNESKSWPEGFFEQIRIEDPALERPSQEQCVRNDAEPAVTLMPSLLVAGRESELLLRFSIRGIHSEKFGGAHRPWDLKVADAVLEACRKSHSVDALHFAWFAVYLSWSVIPDLYRRDLDNFRLKPILDCLTRGTVWPDDSIKYVRAIYNEVRFVEKVEEEQVEVSVYGMK
jgi:hypothetical protein